MAASTPQQRRLAGILRIVSFPIALAVLVVAAKLIAMSVIAALALAAYSDGDYEKSAEYARMNLTANVIEPHKAHFDLGTAYLGSKLFQEARDELEIALETAPEPDSCDVRMNLSYAIEGLGDVAATAGEFQKSADLYLEAADVLAQSDESCPDTTERQEELQQKAQEQQEKADAEDDPQNGQGGQNGQDPSDDPAGGDTEGQTPIENLEDLLEQSQQDKEDNDAADRAYDNSDDLVDKPW